MSLRNLFVLITILSALFCFGQAPAYYKLGEKEFSNHQVYTLLFDNSTDVLYAGTNGGLFAYKENRFVKIKRAKEQIGFAVFSLIKNSKNEIFCINLKGQFFKIENDSLKLIYQFEKEKRSNYYWCNVIDDDIIVSSKNTIIKINNNGVDIIYETTAGIIRSCTTTSNGVYFYLKDDSKDSKEVVKYTNGIIEKISVSSFDDKDEIRNFITLNHKTFALTNSGELVNLKDKLTQKFNTKVKEISFRLNNETYVNLGVDKGARYFYLDKNKVTSSPTFFNNTFLSAFAKSEKGTLFYGTFNDGIIVVPNYKVEKIIKNDYLFLDIATTPNNKVAICTRSGEIFTFKNNIFKQIDKVSNNVDNIFYLKNFRLHKKNEFVYNDRKRYNLGLKHVIALNSNKILLSSANGIALFDKKQYKITKQITKNRCNVFTWSKKDSLIYFIYNDKAYKIGLEKGIRKQLLYNNKSFKPIDFSFVNDQLLCATLKHGILVFKNDVVQYQLTKKDGLISNTVSYVTQKGHFLYILVKGQIQIYDLQKRKFLSLGINEGVLTKSITKFTLSNDKLWLLEKHSFSSVDIKTITENHKDQQIAKLYIDSLLINDHKIDHLKQKAFKYTDNKLTIYFDYRDFNTKSETKIEYLLKGYHKQWKKVSAIHNQIEFQYLPTGNYTLKIRANYRGETTSPFEYNFKIKPPFWRSWWFYTLLALVLVAIAIYWLQVTLNKEKQRYKTEKLKASMLDSELKALRSQMNPHFIFNALNSIQGLILEQKTVTSYDYIVLFAKLVRNTLNYSSKDFISIHDEIEFLEVYLKLEHLRFGKDFTYSIDYLSDKDIEVPSLIIQPFIENALLHGLLHKKGDKKLNITFELIEEILTCTIIDNGVGRKKSKAIQERQGNRHTSFALKAISKRLEILSERMGGVAKYSIIDLYNYDIPIGTKVVIIMPYKVLFK